jgi:hypothetical protein
MRRLPALAKSLPALKQSMQASSVAAAPAEYHRSALSGYKSMKTSYPMLLQSHSVTHPVDIDPTTLAVVLL